MSYGGSETKHANIIVHTKVRPSVVTNLARLTGMQLDFAEKLKITLAVVHYYKSIGKCMPMINSAESG